MPGRDNRPTTPAPTTRAQKVHAASGWTALLAALPALLIAWQSGDKAESAEDAAEDRARDVSERGYERDGRLLRRTKRVMEQQAEDIDACFDQLEEVAEALDELYDHVGDEDAHKMSRRNPRNTRPVAEAPAAKPTWDKPDRPRKPHGGQVQMPANLEDL